MSRSGEKPPLSKHHSNEGTLVDLGDDLLEVTADLQKRMGLPGRDTRTEIPEVGPLDDPDRYRSDKVVDISDALKSADILMSEGLYHEAKKVIHSALRRAPHHVLAREKLKTLQDLELKEILSGRPSLRIPPIQGKKNELDHSRRELDVLVERLDKDLSLGLSGRDEGKDSLADFSLFQNEKELQNYARNLDRELSDLSMVERIDMGIGFLEMDLPSVAIPQFQAALRLAESTNHLETRLSAIHLLALSMIRVQKPYEAILILESLLSDSEVEASAKIHFFYLMGMACDSAGKLKDAEGWFKKCYELDPYYRDVADRVRGR